MLIKVCGMRAPENIRQVAALGVDWMGFIFYPQSPRYIAREAFRSRRGEEEALSCRKVGVFVDAPLEEMLIAATDYRLDYLQLHGQESPDTCYALQKRGIAVIKAFAIASAEELQKTSEYEGRVDYFLFDTPCEGYGGSGRSFDWSVLSAYQGKTPFLLSGGLNPDSAAAIRRFNHPRFAGIDLNSGFETSPALKDVEKLKAFITDIRKSKSEGAESSADSI